MSVVSMAGARSKLLGILAVAGLAAYIKVLRPMQLRWGATDEEVARQLPGDDVVEHPTFDATRAVTVEARPEQVWPWLMQMGQDRAGFYTHNWVEKLLLSGIRDVHELHSEWQYLEAGDLMRTNREIQPGHPLGWPVVSVDPPHSLVLRSKGMPVGSYAFVLVPLANRQTRLIVRDRASWPGWQELPRLLIFEPGHAYMETGVLRGIKQRVEAMKEVVMA